MSPVLSRFFLLSRFTCYSRAVVAPSTGATGELPVKAAFSLLMTRPAARALVFTIPDRPSAVSAAYAGVTLVMQRVVGHFILFDVAPYIVLRPANALTFASFHLVRRLEIPLAPRTDRGELQSPRRRARRAPP